MNKTDVNAVAELFSMCEPIQPIDYIEKNNELYDNRIESLPSNRDGRLEYLLKII